MTPLSQKKSSTNYVEKGNNTLADTLLTEKKYPTKNVDKCTDELANMKQAMNKIRRKVLDQF